MCVFVYLRNSIDVMTKCQLFKNCLFVTVIEITQVQKTLAPETNQSTYSIFKAKFGINEVLELEGSVLYLTYILLNF